MKKIRIDQYLAESGLVESREKAKRSVMAGIVFVGVERVNKPSETFTDEQLQKVVVKGKECPYVSRAGLKLERALKFWQIDMTGLQMLDVGSSTGGFTDCALQNHAQHVVALDVGTNQLVYKLRTDQRVTVMEKTNFRTIDTSSFSPNKFDIITMDVSFISVNLLIENVSVLLADKGIFICLIKPQFEVGKDVERNSKGVITDYLVYKPLLLQMIDSFAENNLIINDIIVSPIKGGNGNIEFLTKVTKHGNPVEEKVINKIVDNLN